MLLFWGENTERKWSKQHVSTVSRIGGQTVDPNFITSRNALICISFFFVYPHFFIRYPGTAFQSGNPSGILTLVTVGRRWACKIKTWWEFDTNST